MQHTSKHATYDGEGGAQRHGEKMRKAESMYLMYHALGLLAHRRSGTSEHTTMYV